MKIAFLIRALDVGGAERQLELLAGALARSGHQVAVFVFYGGRPSEARMVDAGVQVHALRKAGRWDLLPFGWRLVSSVRRFAPDVLYSFLPSANIVASLARPCITACVVWGIRAANMQSQSYDWLGRVVNRIEAAIAGRADGIIANSRAGYDWHVARGYPAAKMTVIFNGIEAQSFCFDMAGRERLRGEWGIGSGHVLVGIVGRFDPMKGHEQFLAAAARVLATHADARFVVVGGGTPERAAALRGAVPAALAQRLVWASVHVDMASVYSAMDVLCSASLYGEGFSNTLAEGLLCGCLCVASRVGDAGTLLADSNRLFEPGDVDAMVDRISAAIADRAAVARGADRARIEALCSTARLVRETEAFFGRLLAQRAAA
jgi:glycosyltransferase involved in cell wall biosynthesis